MPEASWQIRQGDVLDRLREMPGESVQCVVTSPPYWGLRQYFFDKATVLRDDLSAEDLAYVTKEIERRGIKPHVQTP